MSIKYLDRFNLLRLLIYKRVKGKPVAIKVAIAVTMVKYSFIILFIG